MVTSRYAVSISDNFQVKAAGKAYANVKSVWPVCLYVAAMSQKNKKSLFEPIKFVKIKKVHHFSQDVLSYFNCN